MRMVAAVVLMGGVAVAQNLMPWPAGMTQGQGRLAIGSNFAAAAAGSCDARVPAALERMRERVALQTGIPLHDAATVLTVECRTAGESMPSLKADESYTLEVTPQAARISAATSVGALRGIETFLQLIEPDQAGFSVPALRIEDKPRFSWRGLMIDAARHWQPVDVVKRNLDAMAAVKLNVFHWHLTDDQGFRIESKRYPELQRMGSDGNFYTQDQVRDIIEYARQRGIRVVPEFDMPGHTTSWFVSHPELASGPGPYQIERRWGIMDPAMDPTRDEVYAFLDNFIGEMTALFPDEYFHVGGDEVNGKQWNANPKIQEFKKAHGFKNNEELQTYFSKHVLAIVTRHGKKMVGWDEILNPELPKDAVVQSWRGPKGLAQAAGQGYQAILSNGYYVDLMYPASQHYLVDPYGGAAANLPAEAKQRILGGESCMWSEYVVPENIDSRTWPRTAAIAERFWSPEGVRDVASMYRRLAVVSRWLETSGTGVRHRANYPIMMERLAGDRAASALKVLAGAVEPVKEYRRGDTGRYTQFTPLNRLVDAIPPESDVAREFSALVDKAIAGDAEARTDVRKQLVLWRDLQQDARPAIASSFLVSGDAAVAQDVSALAGVGLAALDAIESGKKTGAGPADEVLKRAAAQHGPLIIVIVEPVRRLVEAGKAEARSEKPEARRNRRGFGS